jgi:hypothetical protein
VPSFFPPITSSALTKSNLYLANSLAYVVSDPDLHRLLAFHVPKLVSVSHWLDRTKESAQARVTCIHFVRKPVYLGEELLVCRPTPKLEDHCLSAVRDCLFNIFAATLYTGAVPPFAT